MKDYTFRAMEIHDFTQIWNLDEIRRRLDFMVKNNMNAMELKTKSCFQQNSWEDLEIPKVIMMHF